jgi:hypothetical protein
VSDGGARPKVARCSFLVLGEDSAGDAHETLVALAKKIFRLVDDSYDWQQIRFEPPESPGARAALRGNLWKSENPKDYADRRALIGYIATKLLEGETTFVLYHIDGDRAWADREESENVRKFRAFIETDVRQFVEHRRRQMGRAVDGEFSLAQLLLMVPFYSLEAWVFQSTQLGRRLCQEHEGCNGDHVELFEAWEADRTALDEVRKPKEQVCFKGQHNHRLAEALDVDTVYYAERSLHDTVEDFMRREPLVRALALTRPG